MVTIIDHFEHAIHNVKQMCDAIDNIWKQEWRIDFGDACVEFASSCFRTFGKYKIVYDISIMVSIQEKDA